MNDVLRVLRFLDMSFKEYFIWSVKQARSLPKLQIRILRIIQAAQLLPYRTRFTWFIVKRADVAEKFLNNNGVFLPDHFEIPAKYSRGGGFQVNYPPRTSGQTGNNRDDHGRVVDGYGGRHFASLLATTLQPSLSR